MSRVLQKDSTSKTLYVFIRGKATTPVGMGLTGLAFGTAGLKFYYTRAKSAAVAITLVTQTVTGVWSSGGFVEVDATNAPGLYRLDIPNAALVTGQDEVNLTWTGANTVDDGVKIQLVDYDPVAAGLTTTQIRDAILTMVQPELTAVPPVNNATFVQQINWLFHRFRNKRATTNTVRTLYRADGTTVVATSTLSDDGTTFGETADA